MSEWSRSGSVGFLAVAVGEGSQEAGVAVALPREAFAPVDHVGFVAVVLADVTERVRQRDLGTVEQSQVVGEVHVGVRSDGPAIVAGLSVVVERPSPTGADPPTGGAHGGVPSPSATLASRPARTRRWSTSS
jgi:hypothetical protein